MNHIFISDKYFGAEFAKWIVAQSPEVPVNLVEIVCFVISKARERDNDMGIMEFKGEEDLDGFLKNLIENHGILSSLNDSDAVKDGKEGTEIIFVSRYSEPDPYYDFVDLGALRNNIKRGIMKEANA